MAASSSLLLLLVLIIPSLKTIIGIGMTNDLRIILRGQAWFMWIWAPVLKPENGEELHQSLENNDWCWPVSFEAFLGSPALLFSLSLFLYYFFFLSFFSLHPPTHPSTGFPGLGKKQPLQNQQPGPVWLPVEQESCFQKNDRWKTASETQTHTSIVLKIWGSGPFRSRSCKNILNTAEPLLQGWPVVKCAVVRSDGGLVTEIIVDTHYLSSVNLSYLCLDSLVSEIWENYWTCITRIESNSSDWGFYHLLTLISFLYDILSCMKHK